MPRGCQLRLYCDGHRSGFFERGKFVLVNHRIYARIG